MSIEILPLISIRVSLVFYKGSPFTRAGKACRIFMKAYHIYLLRHGMTQQNKEGRYIGKTDAPLSADGERQLLELSSSHDYPYAEVFLSSPLARCTRSLELLYPGSNPILVPDLAECNFGEYEGKTIEELKNDESYRKWIDAGSKVAPKNGESAEEFKNRCCAAFEKIVDGLLRSGSDRAVIMAHGGTIMFILGAYGYPQRPFYEWTAQSGTGYEIVITPQLWMSAKAIDVAERIPFENADQYPDE